VDNRFKEGKQVRCVRRHSDLPGLAEDGQAVGDRTDRFERSNRISGSRGVECSESKGCNECRIEIERKGRSYGHIKPHFRGRTQYVEQY
jgi:hypothetical protein